MKKFEDEIFNYLTLEENFESSFELCQVFPEVQKRLLTSFWSDVKSRLEQLSHDRNWKIELSDVYNTYSKLSIEVAPSIKFLYEKLQERVYYGMWFDLGSENFDAKGIYTFKKEIKGIETFSDPQGYWIFWKYQGLNFSTLQTQLSILNDKRAVLVADFAECLFQLAETHKDLVPKIEKYRVKGNGK